MEPQLKQRLVGAAVLVALAVIFLPMLVKGPAPDSGVSDLPLTMPDAPGGDYATRDLPLAAPAAKAPLSSVLGGDRLPMVDTGATTRTDDVGGTAVARSDPPDPAHAAPAMFPAATAGGNYAVSFGSYGSRADADAVVGSLRASQLPGYREAGRVEGRDVWRVRIGPYATRADAEAARLRAAHVRDDLDARVVVLDAPPAPPAKAPAAVTSAPTAPVAQVDPAPPSATPASPPAPAAAVAPTAAADVGFAVQVGAFSRPADATALRDRLRAGGFNAMTETVDTDKGTLTRVKAGPVLGRAEAEQLKAQLKAKFNLDGLVRSHP